MVDHDLFCEVLRPNLDWSWSSTSRYQQKVAFEPRTQLYLKPFGYFFLLNCKGNMKSFFHPFKLKWNFLLFKNEIKQFLYARLQGISSFMVVFKRKICKSSHLERIWYKICSRTLKRIDSGLALYVFISFFVRLMYKV